MKPTHNVVAVQWPGEDALAQARAAIGRGSEVAIALPPNMHYALYRHLHPGEIDGATERIELAGGVELLEPIAAARGLEDLAKLRPALRRGRYRVRLTSPEPILSLTPPEGTRP